MRETVPKAGTRHAKNRQRWKRSLCHICRSCVNFLVSWDLFFGACHFCSFETVELALISISRTVLSNFWVWMHFYDCVLVQKGVTGYKIIYLCSKSKRIYDFQACHYNFSVANHVLFVSILDPPKNRSCQNLVFLHVWMSEHHMHVQGHLG